VKIIINVSNLNEGGGVQVALSFIRELKKYKKYNFHVFSSFVMYSHLKNNMLGDNVNLHLINNPISSIKTRYKTISKLRLLEKDISPHIVFTIFGPSYWRPESIHLQGFADGWVYNKDSIAYHRISFLQRIKRNLLNFFKIYHIKKEADYHLLETNDAKLKFSSVLNIPISKVFVVGNTCSSIFYKKSYLEKNNKFYIDMQDPKEGEFRFVYITHNHTGKNLNIINCVVKRLNNAKIKFVLTIDDSDYQKMFSNNPSIINLGPIPPESCPSIYKQCNALFAPTLLETFSAAYPESMKMGIPILTSDFSFATDVCKDSALYFNPLNVNDIVSKINSIVNNAKLRNDLIKKGLNRIKSFETAEGRAKKYLRLCSELPSGEFNKK